MAPDRMRWGAWPRGARASVPSLVRRAVQAGSLDETVCPETCEVEKACRGPAGAGWWSGVGMRRRWCRGLPSAPRAGAGGCCSFSVLPGSGRPLPVRPVMGQSGRGTASPRAPGPQRPAPGFLPLPHGIPREARKPLPTVLRCAAALWGTPCDRSHGVPGCVSARPRTVDGHRGRNRNGLEITRATGDTPRRPSAPLPATRTASSRAPSRRYRSTPRSASSLRRPTTARRPPTSGLTRATTGSSSGQPGPSAPRTGRGPITRSSSTTPRSRPHLRQPGRGRRVQHLQPGLEPLTPLQRRSAKGRAPRRSSGDCVYR